MSEALECVHAFGLVEVVALVVPIDLAEVVCLGGAIALVKAISL